MRRGLRITSWIVGSVLLSVVALVGAASGDEGRQL